jgi:hypothetical protein
MSLEKLTQLKQKLNQIPSQRSVTVSGLQSLMSSKLDALKQQKPVLSQPLSPTISNSQQSTNPLLNNAISQPIQSTNQFNTYNQNPTVSRPSFEEFNKQQVQGSYPNNSSQIQNKQSFSQSFNNQTQNKQSQISAKKQNIQTQKLSSKPSKPKRNIKKILIIVISSLLLLSLVAGIGIFGYYKFIYKDNSLYKANSDLISGSIQKLDKDFELINKLEQIEGENCTNEEEPEETQVKLPKCIEVEDYTYYSAGKFLKGKLKDMTRILSIGNNTGSIAMYATKDYTKFVLNGDPELNNVKEDSPQFPYKLFRRDKFSSIDQFENELPNYFGIGSIFSLAKSNPNPIVTQIKDGDNTQFSLEDKESKIVGSTSDNNYKVFSKKDESNNSISYSVKDKSGLGFSYNVVFKSSIEKRNNLDQEGKKIEEETQKIQQELIKAGSDPEEEGFEDKILAKLKEKFPNIEDRLNICEYLPTLLSPEIKTASSKFFYRYGSDKECGSEIVDFGVYDLEQGDIEKIGDSKVGDQILLRVKPDSRSKLSGDNDYVSIYKDKLPEEEIKIYLDKNPTLALKTPFDSYLVLFVESESSDKVANPQSEENDSNDTQKEAAIDSNTKEGNSEISEPKTDSPASTK